MIKCINTTISMAIALRKTCSLLVELGISTVSYCEEGLSEIGQSGNPDVNGYGSYHRQ